MSDEPEKSKIETIDDYINEMGRALNVRPVPQGFYAWLDELHRNMPMYFGRTNLNDIEAWMTGFWCGREGAGLGASDEEVEFGGFHDFVGKKYRLSSNRGWQSNIRYMNPADDKQAVDEFFLLLDEFRESKRKAREREAKRAAKLERRED